MQIIATQCAADRARVKRSFNHTDLKLHVQHEYVLSDFLNNSQSLLIQGFIADNELHLYNEIQKNEIKSVIFYKTSAIALTHDDFVKDVNIITLSSNAPESLYQILRTVYTPLLVKDDDVHSNKLQKHLSDLESVLKLLSYGKGPNNTNVILTIEDELEYWKTLGDRKDVSKKERESAHAFSELFEDICQELRTMQSSVMPEVRESVENIGGILDDVWRTTTFPFSQDRMINVFDIIGYTICSLIQKNCTSINLWEVNESKEYQILTLLSDSLNAILTWTSACKSLTETYWPNYALHPWNGKPYVPTSCINFQSRLKEIKDIRSTHSQLNKLLTHNEQMELQTHLLFQPFQNVNIWMCSGTNSAWDAAVARFSTDLRPAEMKIAEKLKPRLHNTSTKQMLYEFMRYQALIERPLVKQTLSNELEIFVSSLIAMLKDVQKQLDADEMDVKMYQPPEMSPVVYQVQWAKQMEAKVKEIHTCADKYLKEFENNAELLSLASKLLKDLKTMYTQLHEEWSRDLQVQSKNGLLQLALDKPVVEFSGVSKMMVVNFNPRLVWVELECRAMTSLGLPPPPATAVFDSLTSALTYARALQQVASFHNTLGERMIPSTRPMMLQAALDLSSLVQDQKAVYWDDIEQLANYTDKLKKAVLKLESQNTYLTNQHVAIRTIVKKLVDTDLLAKQSDWKRAVKDIRNVIETVERNGYKNTEPWRLHWDWQLYKALECQYIKTLLSLHNHFPHVKVDLVLRGHMVQVQPPMEEIRVQHYNQLRRLVSLPAQFVGVQNNITESQSIFAAIVDKHSWLGNTAVGRLEAVLSGVESVRGAWAVRAALACAADLRALCAELRAAHHWEHNFRACKAYGQAVAKMTFDDEKVEWISIGTATLRREFEAQTRSLWSCLMSSLQTSCRNDAATLEAFIGNAMVMLENKLLPKNAKELSEISAKQHALQEKLPEMEKLVEDLKKKGHLLRTWGGDTSVDRTIKEWQKIRELMRSQQQLFEHQAEIVKSSLSADWDNLNSTAEAWLERWAHTKSRHEDARGAHYRDVLDRCRDVFRAVAHWEGFVADKDGLLKEFAKFNMQVEIPAIWKQGENLMKECIDLWTVFKEYNEEFEAMSQQLWVVFQKKLHSLEEFTSKWKSRLEPYTSVTLLIQQELDKYSDLTPLLKYLRGTDFSERNWLEVFSLLEMEYKKPDTLQLNDLLIVAPNIKKHIKALQKICTMASNESAIRNALNELEIWFAGARFAIVYYNDKSKRPTPIVKDFKDILTKISEQQWVVSSLSGGGGGGGADACAAWEGRLRSARTLLRATHHAQRRYGIKNRIRVRTWICRTAGQAGDVNQRESGAAEATCPRYSAVQ
ncbi:hypothetical protein O3G_MSEX008333 [Manduca sexta]|uniref:Cytoplasmic dynein 2 heavy chain 1 n=1 Tax=Manduca sexta TaxID=7130 RepID=A0A921Z9M2_MANSE|nr:hypothetical protein O3G_MSEX008333 [Manduca sexta]